MWHVIVKEVSHFGPIPKSYLELIPEEDADRWHILGSAVLKMREIGGAKPFYITSDACLTEEDREFLLKVMKLDPRDRPTACQLLKDKWFDGVP